MSYNRRFAQIRRLHNGDILSTEEAIAETKKLNEEARLAGDPFIADISVFDEAVISEAADLMPDPDEGEGGDEYEELDDQDTFSGYRPTINYEGNVAGHIVQSRTEHSSAMYYIDNVPIDDYDDPDVIHAVYADLCDPSEYRTFDQYATLADETLEVAHHSILEHDQQGLVAAARSITELGFGIGIELSNLCSDWSRQPPVNPQYVEQRANYLLESIDKILHEGMSCYKEVYLDHMRGSICCSIDDLADIYGDLGA